MKEHTPPGISVILWIQGTVALLVGSGYAVSTTSNAFETGAGLAAALFGMLIIGLGSVVHHLARIESHLQPNPPAPETAAEE